MTRRQKKQFKYIAKLCNMGYNDLLLQVITMHDVSNAPLKEVADYLICTTFPMRMKKAYSELFDTDFIDVLNLDFDFVITELYHKDPAKYWRQYKYVKTL